ncbi:MAG: hypothetical protein HYX41_01825 [Bdellovibrio sp.]|nr:hypothetical protein [Bdellovibrio sp.]
MKLHYVYLILAALLSTSSVTWGATDNRFIKPAVWTNEESSTHRTTIRGREKFSDLAPFSPGSNNIALDIGQVFLMGDLTRFSDSIGTQIHYTYGVSDLFSFDSAFSYSEHSDGKFSMTSLSGGMRLNMSWYDKIIPYLVFGLGFYRPSYKDWTAQASGPAAAPDISTLLFGVHAGPGVDLEISKMVFFGAGLTFHSVFGAAKPLANGTPLNLGGTYATFLLHAGVSF